MVPGTLLSAAYWLLARCPRKCGLLLQARRGHHLLPTHWIMYEMCLMTVFVVVSIPESLPKSCMFPQETQKFLCLNPSPVLIFGRWEILRLNLGRWTCSLGRLCTSIHGRRRRCFRFIRLRCRMLIHAPGIQISQHKIPSMDLQPN